ncbi:hypothetical protein Q8F55_004899 [Vanrija albida]|uniref:F-box domain-containing protein n=1 Tax=Vanrija albida TaxID=181172 RepID=A0ABR3Q070_9TREE
MNKMTSLPPPIPSSNHMLLQQDHIIDCILGHVPKRTLVVCLRACEPLQYAAARRLYHTVTLNDDKFIAKFFKGVEVGTSLTTKSDCGWLNNPRKGVCQRLKKFPKVDLVMPSPLAPPPVKTYDFLYGEASGASKEPIDPVPASLDDEWLDEPSSTSKRNTKAPFLALVKVLTIGDHHLCTCAHFGPTVAPLLSRIQVLRITAHFDFLFSLNPPCDGNVSCPLMTAVKTPKIVFRNLDGQGIPLPQFNRYHELWKPNLYAPLKNCVWTAAQHITEVVLFFPTHARRYGATNLVHIAKFFPNTELFKVIFWDTWEGWMDDDEIQMLLHTNAKVTLWGLGHLTFAPIGDISHFWHSGNMAPDLSRMVWTEIHTGIAFQVLAGKRAAENDWVKRVMSFCLSHYMAAEEWRFGELEAGA